jgi:hypothetical protein
MKNLCETCDVNPTRCEDCENCSHYKEKNSTPIFVYLMVSIILVILILGFLFF